MDVTSKELSTVLRTLIVPWAKAASLRLILAQHPFSGLEPQILSLTPEPLLAKPTQFTFSVNSLRWPQLGLHACRYPCIGCVLEGETDISFGVRTGPNAREDGPPTDVATLSLSPGDCFMIPPGVPYSDASRAHWRRPNLEAAHSRVLWLRTLPMGAMLQLSRTSEGLQKETPGVLTRDPQLLPLTKLLISGAQRNPRFGEVTFSYLITVLLSASESLLREYVVTLNPYLATDDISRQEVELDRTAEAGAAVIERAREFIHSHLSDDSLSLPLIARAAYVSSSRLERLFRAELQTSVMKYVTHRRVEEAQQMLGETDVSVQEIAALCGYPHRTHFSRVFMQITGMSPREFRQQKQIIVTGWPKEVQSRVPRKEMRKRAKPE